jgi:RNA polymerase sigma factor for flagellar operon FliA
MNSTPAPARAYTRRSDAEDLLAWKRWKATGDRRMRDKVIARFLPAVRSIAMRRARSLPSHIDVEDLCSCGYMGLMAAVDSYDDSKGAPLGAWIAARVSGAILDELRRDSRLPRSVVERQKQVAEATGKLEVRMGRPPSRAQVAAELGLTIDELCAHEGDVLRGMVESLDKNVGVGDSDAVPLVDLVMSGDRDGDPVWQMEAAQTADTVMRAVNRLDDQERLVFANLYQKDASYEKAGVLLGVSASRVGQINKKVRSKLTVDLAELAAAAV